MSTLLLWDQSITSFLYFESASQTVKNILFVFAGGLIYVIPVLLLVMFFRSHRDRLTSMKIFLSAVIAWQVFSNFAGNIIYTNFGFRDRPFAGKGISELFLEQPEKAFPSDHSAVLAVVVLSLFIYKYPKLGYVFLILGLASSLARVVIGFHWFGDILGGWLLGAAAVGVVWVLDKPLTRAFEWFIQKFSKDYGRR